MIFFFYPMLLPEELHLIKCMARYPTATSASLSNMLILLKAPLMLSDVHPKNN